MGVDPLTAAAVGSLVLGAAGTAKTMLDKEDPKGAGELERKAAKEAEAERLRRAQGQATRGKTKYASAPAFGMQNLKGKVGQ